MPKRLSRKRRNGNKNPNRIARVTRNVMMPMITKIVQYSDFISSSTGSTTLFYSTAGTSYLNLNTLLSQGDYTSPASIYQFAKLVRIKVAINRVVAEQAVTSVYTNGTLPMVYIGYIPGIISSTVSNIKNLETALRVNPFNVSEQSREWTVPSVQALSTLWGNTVALDCSKFYSTQGTTAIAGELQLSLASSNAASTTTLYSITLIGEFHFACPY